MSYTSFKYNEIRCETTSLTQNEILAGQKFVFKILIENTGNYDAFEIVQCYVKDPVASMTRPVKELKAFQKEWIQAGKTKEFVFEIGQNELAFYNQKGKWIVEPGKFIIEIAKNSTSADQRVEIEVKS